MSLLSRLPSTLYRRAVYPSRQAFYRCLCTTPESSPEAAGSAQATERVIAPIRFYSQSGEYATALYEGVIPEAREKDPQILDDVASDLVAFSKITKDQDVQLLLTDPTIPVAGVTKFVQNVAQASNFQPQTTTFLSHLAEKKELHLVKEIATDYSQLIDTLLRRFTINVVAATPEDEPDAQTLAANFTFPKGAQISVNTQINKDLIRGYVASTDTDIVDNSLKATSEALLDALRAASKAKQEVEWRAMQEDLGFAAYA